MTNIPVTFTIQRAGSRAIVLANGQKASGWMSLPMARKRAVELSEQGRFRMRKCMCCPTVFLSEGSHHRLCKKCRSGENAIFDGAV